MRERESACEILSSLPTLMMLGKALCTMLGAITPYAIRITNDKGARAHLSIGVDETIGNSRE
jgi:hypothetical protein